MWVTARCTCNDEVGLRSNQEGKPVSTQWGLQAYLQYIWGRYKGEALSLNVALMQSGRKSLQWGFSQLCHTALFSDVPRAHHCTVSQLTASWGGTGGRDGSLLGHAVPWHFHTVALLLFHKFSEYWSVILIAFFPSQSPDAVLVNCMVVW